MTDSLSAAESLMRTQSAALAVRTELGAAVNGAVSLWEQKPGGRRRSTPREVRR